jgi:tRNA (cmo5U34)-methyltransferase
MSVEVKTGTHIPKNPLHFSFDEEVTQVFDDMALRSLPGYEYVFTQVSALIRQMNLGEGDEVWDLGVSTGRGLMAARAACDSPYVAFHGADVSEPMLAKCAQKCPWAELHHFDLNGRIVPPEMRRSRNVKVVILAWTLQFLEPDVRQDILTDVYSCLAPGSFLFIMEKWRDTCAAVEPAENAVTSTLQTNYINWRRDNGYSLSEIVAKNRALANAMKVSSREETIAMLVKAGYSKSDIFGLFQLYNFGGLVAQKRG